MLLHYKGNNNSYFVNVLSNHGAVIKISFNTVGLFLIQQFQHDAHFLSLKGSVECAGTSGGSGAKSMLAGVKTRVWISVEKPDLAVNTCHPSPAMRREQKTTEKQ